MENWKSIDPLLSPNLLATEGKGGIVVGLVDSGGNVDCVTFLLSHPTFAGVSSEVRSVLVTGSDRSPSRAGVRSLERSERSECVATVGRRPAGGTVAVKEGTGPRTH